MIAVRIFAETQQDDDAISDAGTETQAHYQGNDVYANAEAGSSTARPPSAQSDPRLRTRTILLELANELESSRKEMAALQMEMEQSVSNSERRLLICNCIDYCKQSSILQAQIDNRNKELATLYTQLDRFFGLPGFALTKGGKEGNLANQDTDVAKEIDTGEVYHIGCLVERMCLLTYSVAACGHFALSTSGLEEGHRASHGRKGQSRTLRLRTSIWRYSGTIRPSRFAVHSRGRDAPSGTTSQL